MKAKKMTVTITVEVLDLNVVPAMVDHAVEQIKSEYVDGELTATDGDTVSWKTESKEVEF
jgi:hypothetical protein